MIYINQGVTEMSKLSHKPVYTIGVTSELLGIPPHTLRLYEKEGLILSHRTSTNRRLFSDVELAEEALIAKKLRSCQTSKRSGFGLLLKESGNRVNLLKTSHLRI